MPGATEIAELRPILLDPDRLVRAVGSGRRRGSEPPRWRKVELRPVDLSAGRRLQVTRYDDQQAYTANLDYNTSAATTVDDLLSEPYGSWHVDTTDGTTQLRLTKRGHLQVHRSATPIQASTAHDRSKPRLLDPHDPMLRAVGITTAGGTVKPSRQGKLKQVEAFLRLLDPVLDGVPADRPVRVVDLGCGNAYLTFAAYRFLTARRGLSASLIGVDVKAQARTRNTRIAADLGWSASANGRIGLVTFVAGTIADAPVTGADIVLALHACDTATDDALARAVRWQAPVILAAPCCHHDLHAQLRSATAPAPYALVTKHGILRERFADVLTDALRATLLRLLGYRVDVMEFVPTKHTPRNVLIRAVRTGAAPDPRTISEYVAMTREWNIRPRLGVLLDDMITPFLG